MTRLGAALLRQPIDGIRIPAYERDRVTNGIVHLGLGAFHRAHQATIFDAALASGDPRWGVFGVSISSPALKTALDEQDGLYSVLVCDGETIAPQVIGAIGDVAILAREPGRVIEAIAAKTTRIVTLTVTEKGYRRHPGSGELDLDDPEIRHDIAAPDQPKTIPGLLVAALARRKALGRDGLNILSCDNLPQNGEKLRKSVLTLAAYIDPTLADWIAARIRFPSTMVDRIVPATTAHDIAIFAERSSITDQALVKTEPFLQWVIEDSLDGDVPDFAALGATLTRDVGAWELAKLRLLNAAHSALAYTGLLMGHTFVHEIIATPAGAALADMLWNEAQTTLRATEGLDVGTYRRVTLARFGNTALRHRLGQIAADGSQKLPPRLIAPLVERAANGQSSPALVHAIAAWAVCLADGKDADPEIDLADPRAESLRALLKGGSDSQATAIVTASGLFPAQVAGKDVLIDAIARGINTLRRDPAALPPGA